MRVNGPSDEEAGRAADNCSVSGELDFYELLQISPNAEPETIHRVYRLLAQRFHPDNRETGNVERFRALHDAYDVLSDPERRAQYDVAYEARRQHRWRAVSTPDRANNDFEVEMFTRLTVLEVLYSHRRAEPNGAGVFVLDLEDLTGRPREHLEFTIWYLLKRGFIARGDNSKLGITADGVDYLEQNYQANARRRLSSNVA
jgi:curved DNA-binding protein CbpA